MGGAFPTVWMVLVSTIITAAAGTAHSAPGLPFFFFFFFLASGKKKKEEKEPPRVEIQRTGSGAGSDGIRW